MRNIKFRIYDTVNKCFISDTSNFWVNPSFTAMMEWRPEFDGQMIFDLNDSLVFQQYTGLKDKNGVEIYEGDLLLSAFCRDKENPVEVSWGNKNNGWNVNHKNGQEGPLLKIHQQSYEVVGNIFEGVDK